MKKIFDFFQPRFKRSNKQERELLFKVVLVGGVIIALVFAGLSDRQQDRQLLAEQKVVAARLAVLEASLKETKSIVSALTTGNSKLAQDLDNERLEREKAATAAALAKAHVDLLQADLLTQKETLAKADLTPLIKQWAPQVVRLVCEVPIAGGGIRRSKASGVVTVAAGETQILTSKHVVEEDSVIAKSCSIQSISEEEPLTSSSIRVEDKSDLAYINLGRVVAIAGQTGLVQTCESKPAIGDQVIILGYPSVGAENGITATDGIISGFDDDFYITSAKIERGNSGGAAVHVKNNCLLGLPTLVIAGQIESLARILAL